MHLTPSLSTTLQRGMKRGMLTLIREREWKTALSAIVGVFVVLQLLLMVLVGVQSMDTYLKTQSDMRIEIREGIEHQKVQTFYSALQAESFIRDAAFITKEQAYERAKMHDPEFIAFIERYGMANPFPDSIGITLHSLDNYAVFKAFIEQEQWQPIIDSTFIASVSDQQKQLYELLRFTDVGSSLSLLVLTIACFVMLCLIVEIIRRRVFSRTNEIFVETMVGATPLSTCIPFATEAFILLGIAFCISIICSSIFLFALPSIIPGLISGGSMAGFSRELSLQMQTILPQYLGIELLCIPVVVCVGTWIGMQRHFSSYQHA